MTFEEFFLKKKIDLNKLKQADDGLYNQFKSHFTLMGEKSFDHTKKYWFNKLRKDFRLSEEEESRLKALYQKPVETAVKEEKTTETEAVIAKPAGFKPKFKAATIVPKETEENTSANQSTEETTVAKPAGFKPRFKAGATPIKSEETKAEQPIPNPETEESKATTPVGFKPRFKAKTTSIKEEINVEENKVTDAQEEFKEDDTSSTAKPLGFKPRFKQNK